MIFLFLLGYLVLADVSTTIPGSAFALLWCADMGIAVYLGFVCGARAR
ncbi:MAG: hypothetical protein ACU0CO_01255 [Shimia sp.]